MTFSQFCLYLFICCNFISVSIRFAQSNGPTTTLEHLGDLCEKNTNSLNVNSNCLLLAILTFLKMQDTKKDRAKCLWTLDGGTSRSYCQTSSELDDGAQISLPIMVAGHTSTTVSAMIVGGSLLCSDSLSVIVSIVGRECKRALTPKANQTTRVRTVTPKKHH